MRIGIFERLSEYYISKSVGGSRGSNTQHWWDNGAESMYKGRGQRIRGVVNAGGGKQVVVSGGHAKQALTA